MNKGNRIQIFLNKNDKIQKQRTDSKIDCRGGLLGFEKEGLTP